MPKKKPQIGRPPIAPSARRSTTLAIRFKESELKMLRQAAAPGEVTVWCRDILLAAARRALK